MVYGRGEAVAVTGADDLEVSAVARPEPKFALIAAVAEELERHVEGRFSVAPGVVLDRGIEPARPFAGIAVNGEKKGALDQAGPAPARRPASRFASRRSANHVRQE